jgi:hypothetical protein
MWSSEFDDYDSYGFDTYGSGDTGTDPYGSAPVMANDDMKRPGGAKPPNAGGLHNKRGGHGKVGLKGGSKSGHKSKPSFDFGPPGGAPPSGPPTAGPAATGSGETEEVKPERILPEIMTKKEEACYSFRYTDLGDKSPVEHFIDIG